MQSWEGWRVPVRVCWGVGWVRVGAPATTVSQGPPPPSPLHCACFGHVAPVMQGVRSSRSCQVEVVEEKVRSKVSVV